MATARQPVVIPPEDALLAAVDVLVALQEQDLLRAAYLAARRQHGALSQEAHETALLCLVERRAPVIQPARLALGG